MSITSPTILLNRLHRHRLLRPLEYLELVETIVPGCTSVPELVEEMIRRRWLTRFQGEQLVDPEGVIVVGRYQLLDRLGGCGGSYVYHAVDTRSGQTVALKVLHSSALHQIETLVRFRREVLAAMELDHPHVIRAVDGHLDDQSGYLAMEFLPGVDLGRVASEFAPMPITVACEYIAQAAEGLEHIHRHGLIHRDIKPGNLLVTCGVSPSRIDAAEVARTTRWHVVKILDLGLVRTHQFAEIGTSITVAGTLLGTPDYMAPEQARDPKNVDIRADIYSLGCTLFHLLTGRVPFPGGSMTRKLYHHQTVEPPDVHALRAEVPRELALLIARMLAKCPSDRPANPVDVADALTVYRELSEV